MSNKNEKYNLLVSFAGLLRNSVTGFKSLSVKDNPVTGDVDSAVFNFTSKKVEVNLGYEGCEGMFWDLIHAFEKERVAKFGY